MGGEPLGVSIPSEPCVICNGCEGLVPLRHTTAVGKRRTLRCRECGLVREWLISSDGTVLDLGSRVDDPLADELSRLHDGQPLTVADILAAADSPRH